MSASSRPVMLRPQARIIVTILVIALGLGLTGFFGLRAVRSFRELQYIRTQGLDRGVANVDAIRPWMTLRFVAVAYAVPEEFLYSELPIPFDERASNVPLFRLNTTYQLGQGTNGRDPAILDKVKAAVTDYRKNPVPTGLSDVRPWMSIRYVANSSGVAEQRIFTAINVAATGNATKPIDLLAGDLHYPGGPRALSDAIEKALPQLKATP